MMVLIEVFFMSYIVIIDYHDYKNTHSKSNKSRSIGIKGVKNEVSIGGRVSSSWKEFVVNYFKGLFLDKSRWAFLGWRLEIKLN